MKKIKKSIKKFVSDETGLTTVEYAVAGALVAATVVLAFTNLGGAVSTKLGQMATAIGGGGSA